MLLSGLLILIGFGLLIKGADWMVSGASALAKQKNISDLAIGLTIVAFGTSAPELIVNLLAASQDHSDIIFGNVIGSNNFNLFVILGIVGLISPIKVQSSTVWKEIPISFIAVLLIFVFVNGFGLESNNVLSRREGGILLLCFCLFLFYVFKQMRQHGESPEIVHEQMSTLKIWTLIILGLGGLVLGGKLVVDNAIDIASSLGISEKIIGLTIIAAGTSLPELVASVVAATKKNSDIAIGNVIGSNIFNILLVLSSSSIVRPITYTVSFNTDIYLLAGGTVFLFAAMFMSGKKQVDRWEALVLLITFLSYTTYLVSLEL